MTSEALADSSSGATERGQTAVQKGKHILQKISLYYFVTL